MHNKFNKIKGFKMGVQEEIKKELLKEIYGNIDNIYDFIDARFKLDNPCHDGSY